MKNVSNLKRDEDDSNKYKYNKAQQTGTYHHHQQQEQPELPQPTISVATPSPHPRMPLNPIILNPSQNHHHPHRHYHHNNAAITNQDQENLQQVSSFSTSSFGSPNYFEPNSKFKPTTKSNSKSGPSYPYSASAADNSSTANINDKGLGAPSPTPTTTASFISSPSTAREGVREEEGQGEVPPTQLLQHPSLWMGTEMEQHQHQHQHQHHNVQVLLRIRPISNAERASQGHARCLRQDSPQSVLWLPHPPTRFTFDHIASESTSKEMLFRIAGLPMVENCMSGYNSCMFPYGQTGSGKTYSMMGELQHMMEAKLHSNCGMTPCIFDYLFTRIRAEENYHKNEKLNFSCKCSFLEIHNEQITDLLEPSSTNLRLREDSKKGVYIENLTEYSVTTVNDVIELLSRGTVNRKVAATHMKYESNGSHTVFTCIIASQWENDSITHFRFGRLNLVDLAGSERQNSFGAENYRLKEVANVNKSLSTLGFQDFYGKGEREILLSEISELRDQLLETLGGIYGALEFSFRKPNQDNDMIKEFESCTNMNFKLFREVDELGAESGVYMRLGCAPSVPLRMVNNSEKSEFIRFLDLLQLELIFSYPLKVTNSLSEEPEEYNQTDKQSLVKSISIKSVWGDEEVLQSKNDQKKHDLSVFWPDDAREELRDARLLAEAVDSEHICLTKELLFIQEENQRYKEFSSKSSMEERHSVLRLENNPFIKGGSEDEIKRLVVRGGTSNMPQKDLQAKLEKITKVLEEGKLLSSQYQEDQAGPQLSWWKQDGQEMIKIVLNLQEEISALKSEFLEKLCSKNEENMKIKIEWERATLELISFILDESKSLVDASGQIESIACSFSQANTLVGDQVERAAKICVEKDKTILVLQKSLEDAQKMVTEMEFKLSSLKGATIAFTEVGQLQKNEHFFNSSEPANNSLEHIAEMKHHLLMLGTNQVLQPLESRMWETEVDCFNVRGLDGDGKSSQPDSLLAISEEACQATKAADLTSNTSLKANANVKGEEWMEEKASSTKEVEQHKSSVNMLERVNRKLLDQICSVLEEMTNSISLLELSFLQMQKDVEERFREMCSDTLSIGLAILHFICSLKSSLENISTDIMEKDIASFVLYHCYIDEMFCKSNSLNKGPCVLQCGCGKCKYHSIMNSLEGNDLCGEDGYKVGVAKSKEAGHLGSMIIQLEEGDNSLMHEIFFLKKELERKEFLLKGVLFDFSLLQESASKTKDTKDEIENLRELLSQAQDEIETKTKQINVILLQHERLKVHFADTETALLNSESNLHQSKESIDSLSNQISEWRVILKDTYLKKFEAEEQLEEQKEMVKGLEKEILHLSSSVEKIILSSVEDFKIDLERVVSERNQLQEEIGVMGDKLDMANALVDEKEAIAIEARQESEYSKLYAEQKEEEVKVLERSVEVLEFTINVLEKKVSEMDDEVKRHLFARDSLELETQALRQRILLVENFTESMDPKNVTGEQTDHQISRKLPINVLELDKTHKQIRVLEEERTEHTKEIKQLKDYILELLMHAEAQATQYQQKYKILEALFHEVKPDLSSSTITTSSTLEKPEKSSTRKRGSSSPFRCLASLVQQMNLENDQELSIARIHIEELKSLVASQQKEVCLLNARLAATESMTHDVIRDLLGVKLELTNYANKIDQHYVQNLLEAAQQQTKESLLKEQEIHKLQRQNKVLTEEKESAILEMRNKAAYVLDARVTIEELRERDEFLTTQNDMLKIDKTNLLRRVAEQDEMVKRLLEMQNTQEQMNQAAKIKENHNGK